MWEPFVVFNSKILVLSTSKTLLSADSQYLSPSALDSSSRKRLASSTNPSIVCNSNSFNSTRLVSRCYSRFSFGIFTEQSDLLIERPLSSSSLTVFLASANVTHFSTLALTRASRTQVCFSKQATIESLSTDIMTLSAFATLTSLIRLSAFLA